MTRIGVRPFAMPDGLPADLYTLDNGRMQVDVCNFGATIVSARVPDRDGRMADVVLGYDDGAGYRSRKYFLGATVGRCCNRIGAGRFTLNGRACQIGLNDNGKHALHGGFCGFDQKRWDGGEEDGRLVLRLHSPDGEEGFPGNLDVTVTFSLSDENELGIRFQASSDADTVCNLTNHVYFNLAGHGAGDILNHMLRICASRFTEADAESIPTGRILPVEGTPMDFREFHTVGERIGAAYEPLVFGHGYDHNWILDKGEGVLAAAADLRDPVSGRGVLCLTDYPCIQVYSGNYMDGTQPGKQGVCYGPHAGIALEAQYAPDAVNHPGWAQPVLPFGGRYDHTIRYRFYSV